MAAKGPLFFISRPLVQQLRGSREVDELASAALAALGNRSAVAGEMLPYEDVRVAGSNCIADLVATGCRGAVGYASDAAHRTLHPRHRCLLG